MLILEVEHRLCDPKTIYSILRTLITTRLAVRSILRRCSITICFIGCELTLILGVILTNAMMRAGRTMSSLGRLSWSTGGSQDALSNTLGE